MSSQSEPSRSPSEATASATIRGGCGTGGRSGGAGLPPRLDDGTRLHLADIRIPGHPVGFGYIQTRGHDVQVVDTATVREELGPWGMPTHAQARLEPGGLELEITPVAFAPLVLRAPDGRTSRFPRASARFVTDDGRAGTGWIEWNQPGDEEGRQ